MVDSSIHGKVTGRKILPDSKYGSTLLARFINVIMKKGKKACGERVVYKSFDIIKEKLDRDPLEVFTQAVMNVKPLVEIKSRRIGGATYQVPIKVVSRRSEALAFRWIISSAAGKKAQSMNIRLATELMDAFNKSGGAMEKREMTHRMAEANRAFAHFA